MFAEWLMTGLDVWALLDHPNQHSLDCFPIMFLQTHGRSYVTTAADQAALESQPSDLVLDILCFSIQ
jgi:hypothetical protein